MKTIIILINKFIYWLGKLVGKGSSMPRKNCTKIRQKHTKKGKTPR